MKRREFTTLAIAMSLVALCHHFLSSQDSLDVTQLKVNKVSTGLQRSEVEQILGEPSWEKMKNKPNYGLTLSVSVEYDGNTPSALAMVVYGDKLTYKNRAILQTGQSLNDARSLLGDSLAEVPKKSLRDSYSIEGCKVQIVTSRGSSEIQSFESRFYRNPTPNR